MSVNSQITAFATGVLPNIYEFHLYTGYSIIPSSSLVNTVSKAIPRLSPGISPLTDITAYMPFTPSNSEQRLHPSYYRGCWHEVSRCLFLRYRHHLPVQKSFTTRRPSSLTRHGWIRVSPIVQYSLLLPPVGVWAVSQSQCG